MKMEFATVVRKEYRPVPFELEPQELKSIEETHFHRNGKYKEGVMRIYFPESKLSILRRLYDKSWNLVSEEYCENGEIIASCDYLNS